MGFQNENPNKHDEEAALMAIYSFNHDSFGKTTNRAGAAGDNVAYNAREKATSLAQDGNEQKSAADLAAYNAREEATYAIRSHIIPPGPKEAEAWFREQEKGERKNARMSDRFIGALPRELTPEQCIEAVETFCREVTQDRVPWHFALHLELDKKDEPDWNPHAHIIFRDRDIETGRRFLHTSAGPKERRELDAKGVDYWTTKDFREAWGDQMNRALERAGHDIRIDHRSLKEQGIDKEPQIHVGPASQKAASKGFPLDSRDQVCGDRTIPYTLLDEGTRAEHNTRIIERNSAAEQEKDLRDTGYTLTGRRPKGPNRKPENTTPKSALAWPSPEPNLNKATMQRTGKALAGRDYDAVPEETWNRYLAGLRPRTRHSREGLERSVAQRRERRAMQADQKRDREALRQLHKAERKEYRAGMRKRRADLRQKAFEEAKQRNAKKWEAVRKTKNPMKRQLAAAKVKVDSKHVHDAIRKKHLAGTQKADNALQRGLFKQQEQDRQALHAAHQKEQGMLARQHVAERLAADYQHLADQKQSANARDIARMSNAHSFSGQNSAAVHIIANRAKFRYLLDYGIALPANPHEASRAHLKLAHAEHAKRKELRQTLNQQRDARIATRQSALVNVAGHEPAGRRTGTRRLGSALSRLTEESQQQRAAKAVQTGLTLTSEEKSALTPEARARIARTLKRRENHNAFTLFGSRPQTPGKGRTGGGGRGR
jgi:hypothetical protein